LRLGTYRSKDFPLHLLDWLMQIQMLAGRRPRFALTMVALSVAFVLSGCSAISPAPGTTAAVDASTLPAASAPAPSAAPAQINLYTPATTTSVPIILAARELTANPDATAGRRETFRLTIFSNHSQANTLFLRDDVDILVTGLSVGVGLFKNGAPIQVINCNVSGLTYLVTYGQQVESMAGLKGQSLYVPFEGSPIEETSRFFAQREGLVWKQDVKPVYAASDSALALLKQGKALAVALPEPFVSLAEQEPQVHVSFSYRDKWDALTGSSNGYPQVCAFAKKAWLETHTQTVARFNDEVAKAIVAVERDPASAVIKTEEVLGLTQQTLLSALRRTDFDLRKSKAMAQEIEHYYEVVGKPLDASYDPFFYR
jgi:NitT/TauT family transport system substrate-binding protein